MSFLTMLLLACLGILVVALGNILAHAIVAWDRTRKYEAHAAEFERHASEEAKKMMEYVEQKHRQAVRKGAN